MPDGTAKNAELHPNISSNEKTYTGQKMSIRPNSLTLYESVASKKLKSWAAIVLVEWINVNVTPSPLLTAAQEENEAVLARGELWNKPKRRTVVFISPAFLLSDHNRTLQRGETTTAVMAGYFGGCSRGAGFGPHGQTHVPSAPFKHTMHSCTSVFF